MIHPIDRHGLSSLCPQQTSVLAYRDRCQVVDRREQKFDTRPTLGAGFRPMGERKDNEIGILARRKIEAGIIAPIYDEMQKAIGEAKARDILRRAIRRAAIEAGEEMASRAEGGADLESFKAILHLWTKDDALTIDVIEDRPGALDFNVRRCRYAETYRAMGLAEIGEILSCNRDGAFCEGYDPRIKLTRTQTIMGGASHCDFRYRATRSNET
jgi:L-2-amino-thiazoline-4-carboxylic acid hydrolase